MADIDLDKTDYIKAFMPERPVDFGRAVLVVIDMQYATGHWTGALSRRLQAEGRGDLVAYRFGRIHDFVIPNCGTTQKALHEGCMVNFQRLFGRVRSTDQVVAELGVGKVRQAAE